MSDPYVGEIKYFGFGWSPKNWSTCNGATVAIRQWGTLYALIGNQFGGDGRTSFQLPNLIGRSVCGSGQGIGLTNRPIGAAFGAMNVTLTSANLPAHLHTFQATIGEDVQSVDTPAPGFALGKYISAFGYANAALDTVFDPSVVTPYGNGQPHANNQPTLGLTPSIALLGIFPDFG